MRLLPGERELGWTPFAWLIYLLLFLVQPTFAGATGGEWALTAAVVAVFLALYFYGFWVRGRRLVAVGAAIALLGALMMPRNGGANVFFVYAAAFLATVPPPRRAYRLIASLLLFLALVAWIGDVSPGGWIPAAVFAPLIGAINVHQATVRRRNARLRMEHGEVEGLARSAERERIGRDLHDLLGQTLSLITLKSELAGKLVASDPMRAAGEMREVETASREALAEVRRAVRGYRSLGLAPELSRARMALGAAGVELSIEGSPYDLGAEAEGVAALALREAVTNVLRHAGASRCAIAYRQARDRFLLVVEDDGRGCAASEEGSGLSGMRDRLAALGGELRLVDRRAVGAGRGTRVEVSLPLGAHAGRCDAAAEEAAS